MTFITDEKRIALIRIFVSVFFVIGIVMSWIVWHSDRMFPLCPVLDFIPASPKKFDNILPITLILLFILVAFFKKRWMYRSLFIVLAFLLLQDQIRWQPWVYLYVFMLLPFVVKKENDPNLISYFRILIIGVYFWSGIHKFDEGFIEGTFDKMLRDLFLIENPETRLGLHYLGYLIPVTEVLLAVALVFRKTRTFGIAMALITNIVILTYLIKGGKNTVVYPWNMAMMCFVVVLFYKSTNELKLFKLDDLRIKILTVTATLFFIVLPTLGIFNLWDNYLSFKLYSGSNGQYFVAVDKEEVSKIDKDLYPYFWNVNRVPGKYWIYLNQWALEELNVPFYPEMRTFKQVSKSFCKGDIPRDNMDFYRFERKFDTGPFVVFKCVDVCMECD